MNYTKKRPNTYRKRSMLASVAVLAAAFGGYTAASAGGVGPSESNTATARFADGTAADPRLIAPGALPGGQTETYTGITPCRIVDTREAGGPITSAAVRNFRASGNLTDQGGASNCGIPLNASSIAVNLTAITTGGTGFFRAWALGSTPATATLLNYAQGLNPTNQVNIPLCRQTTADPYRCLNGAFTVKNFGSANLVADAVGYYSPPIYAQVNEWGQLSDSSGVESVSRTAAGRYTIVFDRDVRFCAATATDIWWDGMNDVSIQLGNGGATIGKVAITKAENTSRDSSFYVTVTC